MKNSRGGPTTNEGKARSSMNAKKFGIYVDKFLDTEDRQAIDAKLENLCQELGIKDTVSRMMAGKVVHYDQRSERLKNAIESMIQQRLHSHMTRLAFCEAADLPAQAAPDLPQWYITPDAFELRRVAQVICDFRELQDMDEDLRVNGLAEVGDWPEGMGYFLFPVFWEEIFGPETASTDGLFIDKLKAKFDATDASDAFQKFVSYCLDTWYFELEWYLNAKRFSTVAKGIRAQVVFDLTTDPKYLKAETLYQRRTMEALSVIDGMKRRFAVEGGESKDPNKLLGGRST